MIELTKTSESELLTTPVFTVVSKDIEGVNFSPVGLNCNDWVTIIATDGRKIKDTNVLLVKESRYGIEQKVVEFPFGTVENGENPLDAAKRELEEETGIKSSHFTWHFLGSYNPNPAYFNNKMHVYLAEGSLNFAFMNRESQKLDADEDCEPMVLRFESVENTLLNNGMNASGIALWRRHED